MSSIESKQQRHHLHMFANKSRILHGSIYSRAIRSILLFGQQSAQHLRNWNIQKSKYFIEAQHLIQFSWWIICYIADDFECGTPEIPANGVFTPDRRGSFQFANFECKEGYELKGDKKRTCYGTSWHGQQSICEPNHLPTEPVDEFTSQSTFEDFNWSASEEVDVEPLTTVADK